MKKEIFARFMLETFVLVSTLLLVWLKRKKCMYIRSRMARVIRRMEADHKFDQVYKFEYRILKHWYSHFCQKEELKWQKKSSQKQQKL